MSDDPTATVDDALIDRLGGADLPEAVQDAVLAAMEGEEALRARLGRGQAARPRPAAGDASAPALVAAYLTHIEVRGFRGIGETARLDLVPGPGLTVVTGRNGSGKSSFAEAVEFAFTGDNLRWSRRTKEWEAGWANLHVTGERHLRVGLGIEGHPRGGVVECRWTADAELAERRTWFQRDGERRQAVSDLGWDRSIQLYRPFLSYSELGSRLNGKPSERYDSLHQVLGLDRLTGIEEQLTTARKEAGELRRQAEAELPALLQALDGHDDPRAATARQLLAAKLAEIDLAQLAELATGPERRAGDEQLRVVAGLTLPARARLVAPVTKLRAAREQVASHAGTSVERARDLAQLLTQALRHHEHQPGQPCPVCRGRVLDERWAERTRAQIGQLTAQAEQLARAERELQAALAELAHLVPVLPAELAGEPADASLDLSELTTAWRRCRSLLTAGDSERIAGEAEPAYAALTDALTVVQDIAHKLIDARQRDWQPVAEQIQTWVRTAAKSRQAATTYTTVDKALKWLREEGTRIRNQRLAPLAEGAARIWSELKQESNVELGEIQLTGAGTQRRVNLDVTVDGQPGAALGVMSQGELHSLALALFLPRATLPASPLRFLIIDDPVQSMDPAKVYGLARVLAQVAEARQVVVFTHDDRLPTAIRHLQIQAHVRVVSRREGSQVTVQPDPHGDPALRHLDDARAVAKDPNVDPHLAMTVARPFLRQAIEARCRDLVLARGIRAGRRLADLEEELNRTARLREVLTLALFGDRGREKDLNGRLRRLHPRAVEMVDELNRGSHGRASHTLLTPLIVEVARMLGKLEVR